MECTEKDRWNKNFDNLSGDETTELLSHAIFCDYHNCLVTEYMRGELPLLDLYYERKAVEPVGVVTIGGWLWNNRFGMFFQDLHRLMRFIFTNNPGNFDEKREIYRSFYLLKRSFAMNMIQTVALVVCSMSIVIMAMSGWFGHKPSATPPGFLTGLAGDLSPSTPHPVETPADSSLAGSQNSPDVPPGKPRINQVAPLLPAGRVEISGYKLNTEELERTAAEREEKTIPAQSAITTKPTTIVSSDKPVTDTPKADEVNLNNFNRLRIVKSKLTEANKIVYQIGENRVNLYNWTKYSDLLDKNNIPTIPVTFRTGSEFDMATEKILGRIRLTEDSSLEIDFKPNEQGVYTFEMPEDGDCVITAGDQTILPKPLVAKTTQE